MEKDGSIVKKKHKIDIAISIIAVIVAIYHMASVYWMILPIDLNKMIHVVSGLILVYLISLRKLYSDKKAFVLNQVFIFFLIILSIGVTIYFMINYTQLVTKIGMPTTMEMLMGIIIFLLVFEATRRAWGLIIPAIVVIALLYAYFGPIFPSIFKHGGMSLGRLIGYAVTNFQGIFGSLTALSLREVFMFVLLGATLEASGATDFFMKIARGIGGRLRSGPAQSAIVGSAFMGSVQGNITTNVATTGAVTIPLMKQSGYTKEEAGAIEASASTGSQIVPPVMGAAVFVMASTTGVPYASLALISVIPALIYYLFLSVSVQVSASKKGLPKGDGKARSMVITALKQDSYLLISLVVLIGNLYIGVPVALAGLYTIVSVFILVLIKKSIIYKFDFIRITKEVGFVMFKSLKNGTISGVKLGLIMASLGIMIEMFVVTGFAQRISHQMITIAGGSLVLLLLLVALTCILFGVGMPTTGAYITVSVLAAPALIQFGVPLLVAHFFVLFYALMAAVTPPIGSAAIVATGLSQGNYMKTAFLATKLSLPGFILPFLFVKYPEILFQKGNAIEVIVAIISAFIVVISIIFILERYMICRLAIWEVLILCLIIGLVFIGPFTTSVIGIMLFFLILLLQIKRGSDHKDKQPIVVN